MPNTTMTIISKPLAKLAISWLESLLLFVFVVLAVMSFCASSVLRKKRIPTEQPTRVASSVTGDDLPAVKQPQQPLESSIKVVVGSRPSLETSERGRQEGGGSTTALPLWQRRILMGERCKLPRFSGLILYDEHGRPLCGSIRKAKENPAPAVTTQSTLKELL